MSNEFLGLIEEYLSKNTNNIRLLQVLFRFLVHHLHPTSRMMKPAGQHPVQGKALTRNGNTAWMGLSHVRIRIVYGVSMQTISVRNRILQGLKSARMSMQSIPCLLLPHIECLRTRLTHCPYTLLLASCRYSYTF